MEGIPAVVAKIYAYRVIADIEGNVYLTDGSNHIRKVDADGIITTIAGNGTAGNSGDGGPAVSARLSSTSGIYTDLFGNIYISSELSHNVRKVNNNGIINTIAGNGTAGFTVMAECLCWRNFLNRKALQ